MPREQAMWYSLDNAAKIYPAVRSIEISGMFRITAIMKATVDPDCLQIALEKALERFPVFGMTLKKGLFWYYLEKNFRKPRVYPDNTYPCSKLDVDANGGYLFRLSWYGRAINLECFHSLTDGTGALAFLQYVVRTYLVLAGTGIAPDGSAPSARETEDSFLRYYDRKTAKSDNGSAAFHLKAPLMDPYAVAVTHGKMPLDALKKLASEKGVTLTVYLAALILYAVYTSPYIGNYGDLQKKPLKIAIPVNLRRIFPSQTLRNFTAVINAEVKVGGGATLDDFIARIAAQTKQKVNRDYLLSLFSFNVGGERNPVFKFVPRVIKNMALRLSYNLLGERLYTTEFSNLGIVEAGEDLSPFVEGFTFLISPSAKTPLMATACSYHGTFTLSFNRRFYGPEIEQFVFSHLAAQGVPVTVFSNGGDAT